MTALLIFLLALLINAQMCGLCVHLSVCLFPSTFVSVCLPHLLLQDAVEDEDEHALQGVEDCEKVSHDDGTLVDVHQAESPGQTQQT